MAVTDAPVVKIGATTLASSWTTHERIALAGLAITWGRRSLLDRAKAAQLKLEVLDTDGHLASAAHLTGQPITITRGDGRIIFRGRVDDYTVSHVHVIDPANRQRRRVWRLQLSAACKLAELGQAILPGPGTGTDLARTRGPNFWPAGSPAARIDDLKEAGADDIVDAISWTAPYATADGQPNMAWRAFADGLSVLEHLENIYQATPLGYVEYRPFNNSVRVGEPIASSGLALVFTGGVLRIEFASGTPGRSIPARTMVVPSGYDAKTGINDAIDVVQVSSPNPSGSPITVEHATARKPAGLGRNVHRVGNDVMAHIDRATNTGDFAWPFPLSEAGDDYGPRPGIGDGFHDGIDFSGATATEGANIPVAGPGKYVGKRSHPDWGNNVIIDHGLDVNGDRLRTVYCHLQAQPGYAVGTTFNKGDTIGQVGNTGLSYGAHLHYETQVNGVSVSPRSFMSNKQYGDTPTDTYVTVWQDALASDTADMLDQLNGKLSLPPVRFDWRRFEYSAAVTFAMLDTYVHDGMAFYFPGSVFNVAIDAATVHQVVGGTLVYHDGWTADVTLVPAILTATGITVDELCLDNEPTLSDFDPDITIADLGNVSQGVPA